MDRVQVLSRCLVLCMVMSIIAILLSATSDTRIYDTAHAATTVLRHIHSSSNWQPAAVKDNSSNLNNSKTKLIVVYTTVYGKVLPVNKLWQSVQSDRPSGLRCEWSTDKSLYNKSDAVVFHLYNNLNRKDFVLRHLPSRHNNEQLWALMIQEPQAFYYPHQLKLLNDLFNLTITFQSDSDIVIPYGRYGTSRAGDSNSRGYLTGRDKMAVWLVSNCITSSRRENYVQELQKYIDVDVYGECIELSKGTKHVKGAKFEHHLSAKYKFYLAFENADCDDYITEKFWTNLMLGMIPIVRGRRAQYHRLAPPNSYIHADTFITVEALAEYLKEVAENVTLYDEYHRWRDSYLALFKPNRRRWMNDLCRRLYEPAQQTVDVYQHFSEETRCFTYLDQDGRNRAGEHMQNLNRL